MSNYGNFVSLDLDAMANDESRFGRKKRIERLKVLPGKSHVIRILRSSTESSFYRIRAQHWGFPVGHGDRTPLSCARKHQDEPCYFCEVVNEYYNSEDPRQKELARDLKANVTVISNVIDTKDALNDDGSPKVLIWQYSWKLFQEIRSYFRDPDYGDLTHPETGRNFKISSSVVSAQGGNEWRRYDLQVGAKPTEVSVPEALNNLFDLDDIFPVKIYSYEQQQMIADGTWDPRASAASLPTISTAPPVDASEIKAVEVIEEVIEEAVEEAVEEVEEFATSEDDDWDDVGSGKADMDKADEIKKKLAALKKAAKK